MRRIMILCAVLLGARLAAAQNPAQGELFTRVEGDLVRAAVVVTLDPGFHLYHSELGHPQAVGKPTKLTFEGSAIFGEVRFPEPHRFDQSEIGPGIFILGHEGSLTLYAAGRLAAGADGSDLVAKINGLVCDANGCVPYRQTLKPKGAGDDALFAAFPADLVAPAAGGAAPLDPAQNSAAAVPAPQSPAADVPTADKRTKGRADGELYTRVLGGEVQAALRIAIPPTWHLYHTADDLGQDPIGKPTKLALHGEGITWAKPVFPAPKKLDQSEFGGPGAFIHAHEGTITIYARGTLAAGASGAGRWAEIKGQNCDPSTCIDYEEVLFDRGAGADEVWSGWEQAMGGGAVAAAVEPAPAPAGPVAASEAGSGEQKSLWLFLLAAVGGGLFALVMPCTYPMIPITISFFTKQAEKRGGNALSLSLAYGAGIVLIFVVLGVVFGSLIIPFATHPVTNLVIGAAFIYFSLVLFGLVNLQPPAFLMNVAGSASSKGGYLGVFLMGATLVVTSFTCTAPFVGTLLAAGASDGDLVRVALGMAAFGLTMAVPFVILSLVPTRLKAMPRSGEWMNTLKVFMGFVELAAALKFLSNTDLVWGWELFSRELFLLLWGLIFVGAALFLFGVFARGAAISGKRRLGAAASLLFSVYCFWGMSGQKLDFVMTAIAPPYSGGRLGWKWYETGGEWAIVKDDYAAAVARATEEKKLLLVNFTGFT